MLSESKNILTIAIPTFNRPQETAQRLAEISRQLVPGIEVVVFENGATSETRNAIEKYLGEQVLYKPSAFNRGFSLNILRCFENSSSTWVWILGDDDEVLPDSVGRIISWIGASDGDHFLSMRSIDKCNAPPVTAFNLKDLFSNISFAEAIFISSTIWRREVAIQQVQNFCDGGFSMGPQVALMISIIEGKGARATIYSEKLILPKLDEHRWSRLKFTSRVLSLLEIVTTENSKRTLMIAMLPSWNWAAIDSLKEIDGPAKRRAWIRSICDGQRVIRRYTGTLTFLRSFGKHALKELVKKLRK